MKLAHIAIATPRMCGLYETVRELVAAERALEHDARIYDPAPTQYYPKSGEDRGAVLCDKSFVESADVVVDHSGCDGTTDNSTIPHILCSHGRPRHSFLSERDGGAPIYSYWRRIDAGTKYKSVVTFWEQHVGYLQVMFRNKPVHYVPAMVDLKAWTPDGPNGYGFHGKKGSFNAVITDAWRDDVDPFDAINACALAARQIDGFKVHIYGKGETGKGWDVLLERLEKDGCLGEVCGRILGLDHVYRAADCLVTPHTINTRSVREAMACGCRVERCTGDVEASVRSMAYGFHPTRQQIRSFAEAEFNPLKSAKAFIAIAEQAIAEQAVCA